MGLVGGFWGSCAPVEALVRNKSTCKRKIPLVAQLQTYIFGFDSWLLEHLVVFLLLRLSQNGNASRLCSGNDSDAIWARVFRNSRLFRAQIRLPDHSLSLFSPTGEISRSVLGVSNPSVHHILESEGG